MIEKIRKHLSKAIWVPMYQQPGDWHLQIEAMPLALDHSKSSIDRFCDHFA